MTPEEAKNAWGIYFVGDHEFIVTKEQHEMLDSGRWIVDLDVATGEWKIVEVKDEKDSP